MGKNPSHFKGAKNPVEMVSWNDAMEFCRNLTAETAMDVRLPTEAEWEYACRAGTTTPFNTGSTISTDSANYNGNYTYRNGRKGVYRQKTMPVGSFAPNAWGLYDMHGNVYERCEDWYGVYHYERSPAADPKGPTSAGRRVLRGGSWSNNPEDCRSANRDPGNPASAGSSNGFRVVMLPE